MGEGVSPKRISMVLVVGREAKREYQVGKLSRILLCLGLSQAQATKAK